MLLHLLRPGSGGHTGGTCSGSRWNDNPVPPSAGRRVAHSSVSSRSGQPSSRW
ncbi:hypothetical protein [Blastococcus brunescens]|uniref:Uncharacterized protein n=1 Tax=Blastococcus brunescens TaxID=1564165 RepID=A0ABZ1B965_9ACTN|nr:hypothetical protein [Blastococcus sp. BMG 8361]WRL67344.1 hypothetical protein U6N30_04790 [Blastococcus sp. BMG 8361]